MSAPGPSSGPQNESPEEKTTESPAKQKPIAPYYETPKMLICVEGEYVAANEEEIVERRKEKLIGRTVKGVLVRDRGNYFIKWNGSLFDNVFIDPEQVQTCLGPTPAPGVAAVVKCTINSLQPENAPWHVQRPCTDNIELVTRYRPQRYQKSRKRFLARKRAERQRMFAPPWVNYSLPPQWRQDCFFPPRKRKFKQKGRKRAEMKGKAPRGKVAPRGRVWKKKTGVAEPKKAPTFAEHDEWAKLQQGIKKGDDVAAKGGKAQGDVLADTMEKLDAQFGRIDLAEV
jgi:hypothetical protein